MVLRLSRHSTTVPATSGSVLVEICKSPHLFSLLRQCWVVPSELRTVCQARRAFRPALVRIGRHIGRGNFASNFESGFAHPDVAEVRS